MEIKDSMQVIKRDGTVVEFDRAKIENAIKKCFSEFDRDGTIPAISISESIFHNASDKISVERIQDEVERALMHIGEYDAAKAYILFRDKKAELRKLKPVPEKVRKAFDYSAKYFESPIQQFQFFDKYSRFNYARGRRETWAGTGS